MPTNWLVFAASALLLHTYYVLAVNFPWEQSQLSNSEIGNFSAIAFGNQSATPSPPRSRCRTFPGDATWPSLPDWNRLNASLGGALIQTVPQGAVCYPSHPRYDDRMCTTMVQAAVWTASGTDDPSAIVSPWLQGKTCYLTDSPSGNCTLGGFPVYIVNATSVKHVQIAVNFARNNNIRLVIKNTGHDFAGRSVGAGSLSIWTHHLRGFEYVSHFSNRQYQGPAAKAAAGMQGIDVENFMAANNISMVAPGCITVGGYGGLVAGGGYSTVSSLYGLAADQVVQLQAVTADGRFVSADSETNPDLFYAMRGGGPSTYAILTSAVVKVYPPVTLQWAHFSFTGSPDVVTAKRLADGTVVVGLDVFWEGIKKFYTFAKHVVDESKALTVGNTQASDTDNRTYTFDAAFRIPGMTASEARAFIDPFYRELTAMGIPITSTNTTYIDTIPWANPNSREGDNVGNAPFFRLTSRIIPRTAVEDAGLFNQTVAALRSATEEAKYWVQVYQFAPTEKVGGHPDNAVNPALRTLGMHAITFDLAPLATNSTLLPVTEIKTKWARLDAVVQRLRDLTPGGGAYINEADVQEPDWQTSFFGANYARLLEIKRARDPWQLFWAPATVGSEGWSVVTADGLPTQNGPLCRVD